MNKLDINRSQVFLEHLNLNLNLVKYKCKITKLKCLTQQKEGQLVWA